MDTLPALQPAIALIGMRSNAGPLDNIAIGFGSGVTAFYGQNGAGKTWILNSLRHALKGRAMGLTQLICDFEPGSAGYEWVLTELAELARETRYGANPDHYKKWLRDAIEKWFAQGGRYFRPSDEDDGGLSSDLVDELIPATTFALVPTGAVAPEWDVWLCLPRDRERYPAWHRFMDETISSREEAKRLSDEYWQKIQAVESGEIECSDDEYEAMERRYDEDIEPLLYDPLFEPLAGLIWEYSYSPDLSALDRRLFPMLADDLPIPVVKLFESRSIPLVLEDDEDVADIDDATSEAFAKVFQKNLAAAEMSLAITDNMNRWVAHINEIANSKYAALLQDAPQLTLEVRKLGRWAVEGALHWYVAYGEYEFNRVPLAALSRAESRWAYIAIRRALDLSGSATVLVIDEPEAALHRVAERHMARGLGGLSMFGPQVVVATHSPEVLNAEGVWSTHVAKDSGRTRAGQMPPLALETLAELGLSPSDLLGLYRIFLLVEGEHDEIVVTSLCRDFLDAARVKIVPLRGGSKLPRTVDSQVLFDLTDAHVVAVLDNVVIEEISAAWTEAQKRYLAGSAEEAIDFLSRALKTNRKGDETDWIMGWLGRALKKGVHARMTPYGLAARDIIEYLPVEILVPRAHKSWNDLRHEHEAAISSLDKSKGLHDFKTWLTRTYRADVSVANIRRATDSVREIPEEFRKLGYHLREISTRPRGQ